MSRAPADDDDLAIEITPDILEGPVESGPVAVVGPASSPGWPRAAPAPELEPRAEIDLYLAEAGLAGAHGARVAPLLYEAAHLQAAALGDRDGALATLRDALVRDPTFVATLAPLRQLLSARGHWQELATVYERLIRGGAFGADARRSRRAADLWVERGRILEDRLSRSSDAASGYREAMVAAPDHATVPLARLLGAARAQDSDGVEAALAGLIDCTEDPTRRAALAAELARAQRLAPGSGATASSAGESATDRAPEAGEAGGSSEGPSRALDTLRQALGGLGDEAGSADLCAELEELAGQRALPRVQVGALEELARVRPGSDPATKAALHRERARILRDVIGDLEAAHAALADARRLLPEHPLLTEDMLDVAEQRGGTELLVRTMETSAIPQDELRSALRLVEALGRAGRTTEALDLVRRYGDGWAADPSSELALAALAARVALFAEARDAAGLAQAFEAEGEQGRGITAAHALVRAATLRDLVLRDPAHAERLYRQALARQPGYPPAVDALEEVLRSDERWADLAELFEGDLAALPAAEEHEPRRRYLLQALVGLHRDRLGNSERALVHQRARVELDPSDLGAWILRRDLELAVSVTTDDPDLRGRLRRDGVGTLIQLAMRAEEPSVTAALETEAATLVTGDPALTERFFRDAATDDRTGMATGHLTARLASSGERCRVLATELAAAEAAGRTDVARALRHRLAAERASAGEWREAIAALVPVASTGDELARAFGFDRARRSGQAALEVVVLGDDTADGTSSGLTAPADRGEALERAGNGEAAQGAFREAMRRGPSTDAALGLLRTASVAGNLDGVAEALGALGDASLDDGDATIAAAARRERELLDAARGARGLQPPGSARPDAGDALSDWIEGVRSGDHRQVAGALVDLAALAAPATAAGGGERAIPGLLTRALARSRLAGPDVARELHRRAWELAPANPTVAHGISDVRAERRAGSESTDVTAGPLPDTSADRAARLPPSAAGLATELDLERALEQEARGCLGEALHVYARILARDADCLEAMLGVRRLARAGGDVVGEARALVRLGALVKTPVHAARLFADAAARFEQVGRREEAIAAYLKVLEHGPDDDPGFERLAALLRASADAPGSAKTLDRVLSHRLHRRVPTAGVDEVLALLFERAENRLRRLEDRDGAIEDFKRILKIAPHNHRALRQLATLAIEMRHPADAAHFLTRYLAVAPDDDGAAVARLELATAHEAANDTLRALEALRAAAAARPLDAVPLQRMAELHERAGDWRGAIATMRAWEMVLQDPAARAGLELRIGALLRDRAYDLPEAALAFRRAAELDPLGNGTRELAQMYENGGDEAGRVAVLEQAIVQMRAALASDPLDLPRLHRLKSLLQQAWRDQRGRDAIRAVAQVLALMGEPSPEASDSSPAPLGLSAAPSAAFWATLTDAPALGFMSEVWLLIADAVAELHPPNLTALGTSRHSRLQPDSEPVVGWVVQTAAALGLSGVVLHRASTTSGDVGPYQAQAAELPAPLLVFGAASRLDGGMAPPSPYWVGRALGLLRLRASAAARLSANELQDLFSAAGILAGAEPSAMGERATRVSEAQVKALFKTLPRKDRKALTLQASRFGFEALDAAAWQQAVVGAAERFGLMLAGDVAEAAAAAADLSPPVASHKLRRSEAALNLLRFALSERYLAARRELERGRGG
ncbi:MAG TPA: tetratricopeptide repeat protein [Polyangia bacterium]|nr:tetratricopeptide repeat protein [Polyangia bacterium]